MPGTQPRYPTLHVEVPSASIDEASAALFALGATGVEERDQGTLEKPATDGALLVAHFDDDDRARIAAGTLAWPARVEHIVGDAWRDEWKKHFKPARIGERLLIRPSWETVLTRPDDVVLTLDPGQAFGTGTHESTRLVLTEIEARVRGGERVLDAGCGSGILGIAAVLLGADRAVCVDVDELAIDATRENAATNEVAERIDASTTPIDEVRGRFDLVLANIESKVLLPLARTLASKLAPGGTLILSGLLVPEEDEILAAYGDLDLVRGRQERDWLALVFTRSADAGETTRDHEAPGVARKAPQKKAPQKRAPQKKAAKKSAAKKKRPIRARR